MNHQPFAQDQTDDKNFPSKREFFFHFRWPVPKLGGLKAKSITSSRRKNCRLRASISMSSSEKMSAAGSCVSPRKLTVAVTASSCRVPALRSLRQRLLTFLRTARLRQLNRCRQIGRDAKLSRRRGSRRSAPTLPVDIVTPEFSLALHHSSGPCRC